MVPETVAVRAGPRAEDWWHPPVNRRTGHAGPVCAGEAEADAPAARQAGDESITVQEGACDDREVGLTCHGIKGQWLRSANACCRSRR